VPVALVDKDEVEEELGCCVEVSDVVVSFAATRPESGAGSVAAAPAAGGVLAATSVELLEDVDGVVVVLEALRLVSLASDESEGVEVELSEELEEVEAVGAPAALFWAVLLVLSAVVDDDGAVVAL